MTNVSNFADITIKPSELGYVGIGFIRSNDGGKSVSFIAGVKTEKEALEWLEKELTKNRLSILSSGVSVLNNDGTKEYYETSLARDDDGNTIVRDAKWKFDRYLLTRDANRNLISKKKVRSVWRNEPEYL
jgi:translation initiation factor 1 (eIF-1/SUI1)